MTRNLAARDANNAQSQRDLAKAMQQAGFIRFFQDKIAESERVYVESLENTRRIAAQDPDNTEIKRDLAMAIRRIGDVRSKGGDDAGAMGPFMESLEISRVVAARDRGDGFWIRDLTLGLSLAGDAKQRLRDRAGAHALYRERIDWVRKLLAKQQPINDLLDAIFNLYNLTITGDDKAEKRAWLEEAMRYLVELEKRGPIDERLKVIRQTLESELAKVPA